MKDIRSKDNIKLRALLKELKFIIRHCDRRRNELIFLKCESPECDHCANSPIRAKDSMAFIRKHGGVMFSPKLSPTHEGH
jgi:hypothetical protein